MGYSEMQSGMGTAWDSITFHLQPSFHFQGQISINCQKLPAVSKLAHQEEISLKSSPLFNAVVRYVQTSPPLYVHIYYAQGTSLSLWINKHALPAFSRQLLCS